MSALTVIKNTIEYAWCSRAVVAMPATPRADDPSISKRQWERAFQAWRHPLQTLSATAPSAYEQLPGREAAAPERRLAQKVIENCSLG